ncbi:unnamed protein product, partial [methanotrophic bacterial endosymbiont of Bathymodiolus sp.]
FLFTSFSDSDSEKSVAGVLFSDTLGFSKDSGVSGSITVAATPVNNSC